MVSLNPLALSFVIHYPKMLVATCGFGGVTVLRRAPDTISMVRLAPPEPFCSPLPRR
ncbi:hypothetical protein [Candidatus Viridilinea mediisalina]|uniref:hypothetical protein n=1 Tax=Candidatus Viridilinea mediisalina TaxID=2024553 RepID=UPI0013FE4C4F|nr:hypothetical protein [Candidatus Viridilinea mediisalina]